MIHSPCGDLNPSNSCVRDGKCTKGFPKPYNDFTIIDAKGFPVYRRRKASPIAIVKNVAVDSSWVVPYNPML